MRKIILLLVVVQLAAFVLFSPLTVRQTHAATFLEGIINSIAGALGLAPAPAKCLDSLTSLKGDSKLQDENRVTGADRCKEEQYTTITYPLKLIGEKTCPFPFTTDCLSMELRPEEALRAAAPGFTKSSASGGEFEGENKNQIRGYLDSRTFKGEIENRRLELQRRKESGADNGQIEATHFFIDSSGVSERLQGFKCRDILGKWDNCEISKRKDVLRAAARGYMYSAEVSRLVGLNPDDQRGKVISDDPVLGWLHAPCLVDKTCELKDQYLQTAWSTDKLGIEGELPYYGIIYFCQQNIGMEAALAGYVDQMCRIVVGNDYSKGILSTESQLWLRMNDTTTNPDFNPTAPHPLSYLMQSCGDACKWAVGGGAFNMPGSDKIGINFAAPGKTGDYEHVSRLKLRWALDLVTGNDPDVDDRFKYALDKGITPILRICVAKADCPFVNPNIYVDYLEGISKAVGGREFYALAGPNEANSETWLGNEEGNGADAGARSGKYSSAVIREASRRGLGVKFLSPAFNSDYPGFSAEANAWRNAVGSEYGAIAGIAINAYNARLRVSGYVSEAKGIFPDKDIFITETGMYEINTGVPRSQALTNLISEMVALSSDTSVKSINLFNAFGTNPDSNFTYGKLSDREIALLEAAAPADPNDDPNKPPIHVDYYDTPLGPFYNVPTEPIKEWGGRVVEKTAINKDTDKTQLNLSFFDQFREFIESLFPRGPEEPEREGRRTLPGGMNAASFSLGESVSPLFLSYDQAQKCINDYKHEIPSRYEESTPRITAHVPDVIAGTKLHKDERSYLVTKTIAEAEAEAGVDRNNPQKEYNIGFTRNLDVQVDIPKDLEPFMRFAIDRRCGLTGILPKQTLDEFHKPVDAYGGKAAADLPFAAGYECTENSSGCNGNEPYPGGGINLGINSVLKKANGKNIPGLVPQITMPFDKTVAANAGRMVHELAQADEYLAIESPWQDLVSIKSDKTLSAK